MRLDTEFVRLPLRFDAARLAAEVAAVPESEWRPHPQGHPGNSALPLVAAGGNVANDATKGPMRPTPHLARLPYLRQVLASFGCPLGRTRLMRLDGNAEATAHTDTNYYWLERVRIHVPVVTDPAVRFLCGEHELHMAASEGWVFDTWKVHNVLNPKPTRRIHLVSDSVGSVPFWDLVARGARPFAPGAPTGDAPRDVAFDPDFEPELAFENVNQPVVMSPWEQEILLGSLLGDLVADSPADVRRAFEAELLRFRRAWRALWALHGDGPSGTAAYRAELIETDRRLAPFERRLRLENHADALEIARQMVLRVGLNPELARPIVAAPMAPITQTAGTVAPVATPAAGPRFADPVFLVSSPRAGSTLLFETLAQAPELWTIGGESHAVIEAVPGLDPASRGWDSNALTAADATPERVARLSAGFDALLRDRDGRPAAIDPRGLRFLEKTPKNALRIPFLAAAYPDARFVYLYRDPRETLSSMLDAWRSERFVTYPNLPGWTGAPWSLLLVPGWRELAGRPLAEIVARQWAIATTRLLDDLEALPAGSWCVAGYDRLVADPQGEIERLCEFLGLAWDRPLTAPLPLSRHTLTSPEPEKWRHNAPELKPVLGLVDNVAQRARELFANPPPIRPARRARSAAQNAPAPASAAAAADPEAFRSVYTQGLPELFAQLGGTLLVSTYQSGRLIAVRADGRELNTHFRFFPSPMGIAVGREALVLGTQRHIWEYRNQPEAGHRLKPAGKHDACFLPRQAHVTGDIRVHELAFAEGELWVVATRFSCLATLDDAHSFVPRWRPSFVSALSADDRCHLNGVAVVDDRVRYVTALGATDSPQGWREHKATGGILIDVPSGEIVARGLSMPHSPRWYGGRLWVLESGKGEIGTVDLATGTVTPIAQLPGFTRGLAFAGRYAFVGLSQVRESNIFGGLPLSERVEEKRCGVWVIDLPTGRTVGFLRFEGKVEEIFDLQFLPGIRYPEIAEPDSDLTAGAFALPDEALAEVG
jgi:uncharacterized protein (TIGR03032 family)